MESRATSCACPLPAQALPVNKAALQHPFKPAPSSAQLTLPQTVALASDARARERMEFDHAVALKQQLEEVRLRLHPAAATTGLPQCSDFAEQCACAG